MPEKSARQATKQKSAFATPSEAYEALNKKLLESGLNGSEIKKLQFSLMTADDAGKAKDIPVAKAGFRIPYFTLDGKPSTFWRYRYLESTLYGFAALTNKKSLRYVQAPKSINELYLPPLVDWKKIAKDTAQELIITEGELKAACACKNGLPTIGLGGVWNFRAGGKGLHLLPQFSEFDWENRTVFIVYDSDIASNAHVMAAENALARELVKLGAIPRICRLPALAPDKKTGLDDYLVAMGVEAMDQVFGESSIWAAAEELHRLNEEVVYVVNPGLILRLDNLQRMMPRAFVDHAYSPRIYYEQVETQNGTKLLEKSAAKEWLKWNHRSSVERINYAPGQPRVTVKGELNVWPGWACDPVPGVITPWRDLLDFLFKDTSAATRKWFEQWLAWPIQHPGQKLYTAAVLWGIVHGTGKSLVGYTMFKIYGQNAAEIGDQDLQGNFNDWAENKQFVMGDEITGGDKRHAADRMKSMITQKQLRINTKFIPTYTVADCLNYYFTSNHPDAFFLEDGDRRFFVHEVTGPVLPSSFYQNYVKWLEGPGAAALFDYLLKLDLSDFNPHGHAPMTAAKDDMIESGRSDVALWVSRLKDSPESVLRVNDVPFNRTFMSTSEIHSLYDPERRSRVTVNGMGRELRRFGFLRAAKGAPVETYQGLQRLWIVKKDKTGLLAMRGRDVAAIYDSERSVKNGKKVK